MKSKTKYIANDKEIIMVFEKNGLSHVLDISPLGDGEFNAAFKVTTNEGDYVLKIAPPEDAPVLNYESGMMKAEVFWYEMMEKETDILIPKVYAKDFTKNIIKSDCFIMEMMKGVPLWQVEEAEAKREKVQEKKIKMLTGIHGIHGDKFGYVQKKLYDN